MLQTRRINLFNGETGTVLTSPSVTLAKATTYGIGLNLAGGSLPDGAYTVQGSLGVTRDANGEPTDWEDIATVDLSINPANEKWLFNFLGAAYTHVRLFASSSTPFTITADIIIKEGA